MMIMRCCIGHEAMSGKHLMQFYCIFTIHNDYFPSEFTIKIQKIIDPVKL